MLCYMPVLCKMLQKIRREGTLGVSSPLSNLLIGFRIYRPTRNTPPTDQIFTNLKHKSKNTNSPIDGQKFYNHINTFNQTSYANTLTSFIFRET